MKPLNTLRKVALGALVTVLMLSAVPSPALAGDLVRFTVENRSDGWMTIRLYATDGTTRAYYMYVDANSTKIMTPLAGIYTYRLSACGVMVRGTVDLTKNSTWINPECGDKGGPGTKQPNTKDVGKILKFTSFTLINHTGATMKVWLDGPFQYVFIIPEGGSKTVSIRKGVYEWGHYACGGLQVGNLTADADHRSRIFSCP